MRTLRNKKAGFAVISGPYGEIVEMDTITCNHCQGLVFIKPKEGADVCHICYHIVCAKCHELGACVPFEEQLRKEEKEYENRRTRGY